VALRLSRFLDVRPSDLTRLGAFNALIGIDSRLFVDPLLLKNLKIPEFRGSRKQFEKYFREVSFLLAKSKTNGDAAWREAARRLVFRETKGISLGYGKARSAWTYFKRLWSFGLLERRSQGRGALEYRISELGRDRLRWLRSQRG
jgi:hypothetical protein